MTFELGCRIDPGREAGGSSSEDVRPNPRGHGTTASPPAEHRTQTDLKKTTTRETRRQGGKNRLGRKYLWSLFLCFFFNLVSWTGGREKLKYDCVFVPPHFVFCFSFGVFGLFLCACVRGVVGFTVSR